MRHVCSVSTLEHSVAGRLALERSSEMVRNIASGAMAARTTLSSPATSGAMAARTTLSSPATSGAMAARTTLRPVGEASTTANHSGGNPAI
eukprot:7062904-Prymnesium_polylepis.2